MRWLTLALVVAGSLYALAWWASDTLQRPLSLEQTQRFEVQRGRSARVVIAQMRAKGWIDAPQPALDYLLAIVLRWQPQYALLQAGTYSIYPGDSLLSVADRMRRGEVASFSLTVVEGTRFADLRRLLETHTDLRADTATHTEVELLAQLNIDASSLEGRFLPDTYHVVVGTPVSQVLRRMARALESAVAPIWAARDPEGELQDLEQLLVLASIIEKETGAEEERATISGVFHRRLRLGMRLQTDPTVIYGLGDAFDGNLTRAHLRADTPWNTYTRHGLPPTPICLPGLASLQAAAHPEAGDSLYFVSTGGGRHVFSATLAQHQAAVRKYQLGQR